MLVKSKKLAVSNEDDDGFNKEMDEDAVNIDMVNYSDGVVFEEVESIESDSRLEEVEDDVLEQGLEKGSVARVGTLKKERIVLDADLRQEEVKGDENEQGYEGKMVKMNWMEAEVGEMEQELVPFKSDNVLHVVEEKQDEFFIKNKEESVLVESKSRNN